MKKFSIMLIALISGIMLFGQGVPMSSNPNGDNVQGGSRENEFQCLPGAVFSQFYPTFDNSWWSDNAQTYSKTADDYSASGPFSTMRFLGGNFYGCPASTSNTYIIEFYNGNPSSGGTLIYSTTQTLTPQWLGIYAPWSTSTEIYQVDVDLGTTINQLNGWVSIGRINRPDNCYFTWVGKNGGNGYSYDQYNSSWVSNGGIMFFCLGGFEGVVPIGNWALIIGIALVLITTIVRFRKTF
jgi:hypothetical protein